MVDPNPGASIAQRIATLRQGIPAAVRLIAVSKYISPDLMRQAYAAGIRDFGENRVQEAQAKRAELWDLPDVTWHFIGHLQANKVRAALETFDWIHTVDSLKLAQRLQALIPTVPNSPKLLLQVKLRPDPQKYGWTKPELTAALPELDQLTNLNIQGLMTILPLGLTSAEQLLVFQELHNLAETWQHQAWQHLSFQELSMGMSSDYPFALQAQTTMIRLGQVIFGLRNIP